MLALVNQALPYKQKDFENLKKKYLSLKQRVEMQVAIEKKKTSGGGRG